MHLSLLSGLILALAGGLFGSAPLSGAAYQANSNNTALFSILAQATTTATVQTDVTPTGDVTATVADTATGTITATATTTTTVATPVALPTVGPQANLQINPFDWGFLTSAPSDPKMGPFAWIFVILMLGIIGAGVYFLVVKRPQWKASNPVLYKAVNKFAPYALWVGGMGILFVLLRLISLDFFNLRFWLYLILLAAIALAGWIFYWYRTSYPKEIAKYQKTQKARQYMPSGKAPVRSTPAGPSRPISTSNKSRKRK
ncbi:MAG: hypothetical protein ABI670_20675 [Chloroflexota bacterium]